MPQTELEILLSTKYSGRGLKSLQDELKQVNANMDRMRNLGVSGEAGYRTLQNRAGELTRVIAGLKREYRGLDADVKASKFQMLEFYENLTVVTAGVATLVRGLGQFGVAMYNLGVQGAQFQIYRQNFEKLSGGVEEATKKMELLKIASAGNLNEQELILYANKQKLLGFSLEDTIKLLDIVERRADEVGVTFDDGASALERFIQTGRAMPLRQLGIDSGTVAQEMEKMTGRTKEEIDKLEEEDKQVLRTRVILGLFGNSMADISKKSKDNADKLVSVQKELETAKLKVGAFISEGLVKLVDSFGSTTQSSSMFVASLGSIGSAVPMVIQSLAGLKIAFQGLETQALITRGAMLGVLSLGAVLLTTAIVNAQKIQAQYDDADALMKKIDEKIMKTDVMKKSPQMFKFKDEYTAILEDKGIGEATEYLREFYGALVGDEVSEKEQFNIKEMQDKIDEANKKKEKKGGSTKQQKDDEFEKELANIRTQNELYKESAGIHGQDYQKTLEELNALEAQADTNERLLALYQYRNNILDEIKRKEEEANKQGLDALKKRTAEIKKQVELEVRKRGLEYETSGEMNAIRIEMIKNEWEKRREQIGLDYYQKVHNIEEKEFLTKKQRDQLISMQKKKRDEDLLALQEEAETALNQQMMSAFSQSLDIVGQILSMLGLGGSEIVQAFQQALGFVQMIVQLIETIKTIGAIFSFLGFAGGGYTGSGGVFEPAGIVHKGEYVVEHQYSWLFPYLDALRGYKQPVYGSYVNGGHVAGALPPNITVIVNSEVERTKATNFFYNYFDDYSSRSNRRQLGGGSRR